MTKHTPGPWRPGWPLVDPPKGLYTSVHDSDGWAICSMSRAKSEKETTANACLIAAAPDMWEALEPFTWLAKVMEDGDILTFRGVYITKEQVQKARDVYAKARGEE